MPFKSKAQRRKFAQLLVDGKISDETYEEWNRSTAKKVLPERLHPVKAGRKAKGRKTRRRNTTATRVKSRKTKTRTTAARKSRTRRKS